MTTPATSPDGPRHNRSVYMALLNEQIEIRAREQGHGHVSAQEAEWLLRRAQRPTLPKFDARKQRDERPAETR